MLFILLPSDLVKDLLLPEMLPSSLISSGLNVDLIIF